MSQYLTDEQIAAVWDSMPGQPGAFMKQFGYLQFARALFAAAPVPCATELLEEIAQSWDGCEYDGTGAETMDIGAALRKQFARFAAAPSAPALAEPASQWISVDERLPEDGVDVIILHWPYDNRENERVAATAHHVDGVFYDEDGNDMHPPSHWMPLNMPALRSNQEKGGAQ